jgi:hypothetical protein
MKTVTEDREYDNVLLGQGYRTPDGAVVYEYGAMVDWWLAGEIKELGGSLAPVTLHPPRISQEVTRNEPRSSGEKPASSRLGYDTALSVKYSDV